MKRRLEFYLTLVLVSLLTGLPGAGRDFYGEGLGLFKAGRYAQACEAFSKAGAGANNYYYLGLSMLYAGRKVQAHEVFAKLAAEYPDSAAAVRARQYLNKGKSVGAGRSVSGSMPRQCRIRYRDEQQDIVVATRVNGRAIDMIFDTGAPDTWIGTNHLKQLGLALPTGSFKMMKSQLGESKEYKYWNMKLDIQVGPILRRNFPVLVQEERRGKPLIGQTFVQGYQFRIDHSSNELCFDKVRDSSTGSSYKYAVKQGSNEVKIETGESDYISLEASVNGKPCRMLFDTGANGIYFPKSYVSKYGITMPAVPKVHTYEAAEPSYTGFVKHIRVGPVEARDIEVEVAEWDNLQEPLLGVSFYKDWQYTIDREKKVIRFLRRR
ncbi:MAG: aspartyl protease family protein [Candidatus Obscuribacterales bacterium]|nr:aspartyl protease family protein [Cyanobacteria bacterium HKST-UBA01]MCB9468931.1 aspartyl protease family protein [Candidatus Obscuribacterales bacterium]